jgi:nucleoid-associated protein YgaU
MRSISPYEQYGEAAPVTDSRLQVHTFVVTDSISLIAYKYYGDWELWPLIAKHNKIVDVRKIEPGTQLVIPQRPLINGLYESR